MYLGEMDDIYREHAGTFQCSCDFGLRIQVWAGKSDFLEGG